MSFSANKEQMQQGEMKGLLDDDPTPTQAIPVASDKFWTFLSTVTGANTVDISLMGSFNDQEKDDNPRGVVNCSAFDYKNSYDDRDGYKLEITKQQTEQSKRLYWLPWKTGTITSAERADFEKTCDFFMTSKLSGCRFVLTTNQVLHVAGNINGAPAVQSKSENGKIIRGTDVRTQAEQMFTKEKSRRLSISRGVQREGDVSYANEEEGQKQSYAYAFGIKAQGGIWTYKVLVLADGRFQTGKWVTLINP